MRHRQGRPILLVTSISSYTPLIDLIVGRNIGVVVVLEVVLRMSPILLRSRLHQLKRDSSVFMPKEENGTTPTSDMVG